MFPFLRSLQVVISISFLCKTSCTIENIILKKLFLGYFLGLPTTQNNNLRYRGTGIHFHHFEAALILAVYGENQLDW